jgi:glycerol-3-phosphate O-acyltransferase
LKLGHNFEGFIEGTRSRTGKLLPPKFGILKIILDAIITNKVEDCYFVPVSLGYDKVIETPSFVDELLGSPKQKESLSQIFNNLNILQVCM